MCPIWKIANDGKAKRKKDEKGEQRKDEGY